MDRETDTPAWAANLATPARVIIDAVETVNTNLVASLVMATASLLRRVVLSHCPGVQSPLL